MNYTWPMNDDPGLFYRLADAVRNALDQAYDHPPQNRGRHTHPYNMERSAHDARGDRRIPAVA